MPPLRLATRLYIATLLAIACAVTAWQVTRVSEVSIEQATLAGAFAGMFALALLFPLPFAWKTRHSLDTSIILAAVLVFQPGLAILIVIGGALLSQAVRRESWAQVFFNSSQIALQAAFAGLILELFGWDAGQPDFNRLMTAAGIIVAGGVVYIVNTGSVAGIIGIEERISPRRVWQKSTTAIDRAELLAKLGEIGVGLLAAVVVDAHVWALALLLLPAIGIHAALQHHTNVRQRMEETLRGTEANLRESQRIAHLGSWEWNLVGSDHIWSVEACRILGIEAGDPRPAREAFLAAVHPVDLHEIEATFARVQLDTEPVSIDHRVARPDGSIRYIHSRIEAIRDSAGRPVRLFGTLHDITERKHLEERLTHQAFHDALTGLPNRARFTDRLQHALERTARQRAPLAVLFIDLDHFKLINDTLGHEAGDELLISVAERIRACMRPSDTVARLGGDEFTVLLEDITNQLEAERIAARITKALDAPFILNGQDMFVTTSIGIVMRGDTHITPDDLLRDADVALYRAKDTGRARFAVYDASMGAAMIERVNLEADLRRAIERRELSLEYQPNVSLISGTIVGVEALIRWRHPRRGTVSPAQFLGIAEETGLINTIDAWVLEESCRQAREWQALRIEPLTVNVNISGRQLRRPELIGVLADILGRTGLNPALLRLEITEIAAMANVEITTETLHQIHALGVQVVIDDFGTGYSSLTHLKRFPIDTLKLDGSLVAGLGTGHDTDSTAIARAVIGLAHSLNLSVIAEGVEQLDQADALRDLGCAFGQGNYFSPPLTAQDFTDFLLAAETHHDIDILQLTAD